ncbi:hypothetical protein F4703DRAFT_1153615 [Phycomyces blakesleeanus]
MSLLCLFLSLLSSTLCSPFFFKFILREEAAANHHACCLKSRIQGFGESPTKLAKLEKSCQFLFGFHRQLSLQKLYNCTGLKYMLNRGKKVISPSLKGCSPRMET